MKKLFLFWFALCVFSCENMNLSFSMKKLRVVLPEFCSYFDERCPDLDGWRIVVCSEYGKDDFFISEDFFYVDGNKNITGSVLAYPVCKDSCGNRVLFFEPAGAVFLNADSNGNLDLKWSEGFVAYVMQCLFESEMKTGEKLSVVSEGIGEFNWAKFDNQIKERVLECENGIFYNPWKVDLECLLKAVAARSFRVNLLYLNNMIDFSIPDDMEIWSSYVPENRNIKKKSKILIKQSEVNLISDYNLTAIIIVGKSAEKLSIKRCSMPNAITGYD